MGHECVDPSIYIIYVTHSMKHANVIFQSVKLFSNMLKLMPSGAKFIYLYKGSNSAI